MRWCVFYGDGSTSTYSEGPPSGTPTVGVVAVVQDWTQPPQVLHQSDFYWWRGGRWWAGDIFGFLDQAGRYGATWVRQGETIRTDDYLEIMARAVELKDEWDVGA